MPAKFSEAPAVRSIAQGLIAAHHKHLLEHGCRIEFVFRDDVPNRNGREVWGTARKISSLAAYLATGDEEEGDGNDPFFVITISQPIWIVLDQKQRVALVDHELMHLWAEEDDEGVVKLSIIGHDFEGFNKEIERYGLWRPNAAALAAAMHPHLQLALEFESSLTGGQ